VAPDARPCRADRAAQEHTTPLSWTPATLLCASRAVPAGDFRQGSGVLAFRPFHGLVIPRVARGRRGSRLWWRKAAAMLTGPARQSAPMIRLRRQAMTWGAVPVWTREASSAKVVSRMWCSASTCQCPQRSGERLGMHARQGPADGAFLGHWPAAGQGVAGHAERGPHRWRGVRGPLGDRRDRPGAGQHRRGRDRQDRHQRVAAAFARTRVGDRGEVAEQVRRLDRSQRISVGESGEGGWDRG
jgi:hypothetical protein